MPTQRDWTVLDSLIEGCMLLGFDWTFLYVNEAAARTFQQTREDLLGRKLAEVYPGVEESEVFRACRRCMEQRVPVRLEGSFLFANGVTTWWDVSASPVPDGIFVQGVEVNERKKAEEALRHSHALMRFVIEHSRSAIAVHDRELKYVYVSQRYLHEYGVKESDVIGRHHYDIFPDLPQKWRDVHQKALAGEISSAEDDPYEREDGTVDWTRWECRPWYEADGSIGGIVVYTEVITDRKRAEEALRSVKEALEKQNETLRLNQLTLNAILDATRIQLWAFDGASYVYTNREWFEFTGQSPESPPTIERWTSVVHPEDVKRAVEVWERAWEAKSEHDNEFRLRRHDGTFRSFYCHAVPVWDERGAFRYFQGFNIDITDRKEAEAATLEAEQRFQLLAEATSEGILFSEQGRIVDCNDQLASMLGYGRSELIGMHFAAFFSAEDAGVIAERIRSGSTGRWRSTLLRRDGSRFPSEAEARVVSYRGRRVRITVIRDLTSQKEAEAEILRLNAELEKRVLERTAQLEAANRELEAFSYSVSHDLRAPLRAIEGFAGRLVKESGEHLTVEEKRLLDVVRKNACKMSELIDDLLTFSRAGRHEMKHGGLKMEPIVLSAMEEAGGAALPADAVLKVAELPEAEGDPSLIRQVWVNLLSNALKFSAPRERPSVEVGGVVDGGFAVYHVRDNGVGFDPRYKEKLFGVFQRLHGVMEFEGTGIGLALVKRIVERHGGRVWAEGAVNEGATFYFTLPVKKAPGASASQT